MKTFRFAIVRKSISILKRYTQKIRTGGRPGAGGCGLDYQERKKIANARGYEEDTEDSKIGWQKLSRLLTK